MTKSSTPKTDVVGGLWPEFDKPALAAGYHGVAITNTERNTEIISAEVAVKKISHGLIPLVCHAPAVARKLEITRFPAFDVLELFAFVLPGKMCIPTPAGLAKALALPIPKNIEEQALTLQEASNHLLNELKCLDANVERDLIGETARIMENGSWLWSSFILDMLNIKNTFPAESLSNEAIKVWQRLPDWSEHTQTESSSNHSISPAEARIRLSELVGSNAEDRPEQGNYASAVSIAFATRSHEESPNIVIAEAGTGIGKTLGYLSAASLWAERNDDTVWISTYTRNLQRQLNNELDRLYPDPKTKNRKIVIRKGRENYLCLLNYEDAIKQLHKRPQDSIALGLVARWASATIDGDMGGGDFAAWLVDLLGKRNTVNLTDRRGECIYSSCTHYQKCFIESTIRRAKTADIVVANHALVLSHTATNVIDDGKTPAQLVFDEGHHLFDAADNAFCVLLSGQESAALRRWLLGPEDNGKTRSKGLRQRVETLSSIDKKIISLVDKIVVAADILPSANWNERITKTKPQGHSEGFFSEVRKHVYKQTKNPHSLYSLETSMINIDSNLLNAATVFRDSLDVLIDPINSLINHLLATLNEHNSEFDMSTRNRIENVARGLQRRKEAELEPWLAMLESIAGETPVEFVDWFSVIRSKNRDVDVAMHRHWLDPTVPFAKHVIEPSQGAVITSATLRDSTGDANIDWTAAEARTGTTHLHTPAIRAQMASPFDYANQTRLLLITDINKNKIEDVANAYRQLFLASGGGALGIFTAISRLRAVHSAMATEIESAGYPIYAQHVDDMDTGSLVDVFRSETQSCLLGTDAVRDGVDVPGTSLRLIVFDRVPWPRPSILHQARRKAFTHIRYDDMIARFRLKQAFGRLIRKTTDRGVFTILDPGIPSRLIGAFPDGVKVERIKLSNAIALLNEFLR